MVTVEGFRYLVKGKTNPVEFSESIVLLSRLRTYRDGVVDFALISTTDMISIVTAKDDDTYVRRHFGEILNKYDVIINIVTIDDISSQAQLELDQQATTESERFVSVNINYN